MNKYIDSEKLKERVTRLVASARENDWPIAEDYLRRVIDIIDSLQQEQTPTEREIAEAHRDAEMIRERDNARIQQEQPEVDLEKEIKNYLATKCAGDDEPSVSEIARHFYELGINARKEE